MSISDFAPRHRCALVIGVATAFAFALGCSKPTPEDQRKKEAELTSALSSAFAQASTPSAAAPAVAAPGGFVGSCTDKESFLCNEWSGALPMGSEDSCKMMNGAFSKTDRCPTDKLGKSPLAGICTIMREGDERVKKAHSYQVDSTTLKASAESAKMTCDMQNGTFVASAAAAAPAPNAAPAGAAKPKKK
jgi:hypothetical protein